ncbi:hypothetical protein Avbf_04813 [Armadillidium vulgare]|nr:hypothetical protein Avbf_04813 [Armadillidium vulgare]
MHDQFLLKVKRANFRTFIASPLICFTLSQRAECKHLLHRPRHLGHVFESVIETQVAVTTSYEEASPESAAAPEATCQSVKCWKGESCLQRRDINTPLCLYCEDLNDCPVTTTHICASDRNTYHSWCALRYASCRAKIALTVIPHHHCIKNC